MAATKRNAGLTSAVPRATLNDEELVCIFSSNTWMCTTWVKYYVVETAPSAVRNRNCFHNLIEIQLNHLKQLEKKNKQYTQFRMIQNINSKECMLKLRDMFTSYFNSEYILFLIYYSTGIGI